MTTYRLMDGTSGRPGVGSSGTQPPTSPTSYSGAFLAGTAFQVTAWGLWFEGYWWWCPPGGDTGAQTFALWQMYTNATEVTTAGLISAATVTSGTLAAGSFNYVPLATPVPLSADVIYVAATGWEAVNGFPDTNDQFGSGQPYAAGITSGPLTAYSDMSGSAPVPNDWSSQGLFSIAGTDPTAHMPDDGSNSSIFWVDIQVTDQAPAGTSYRLRPGTPVPLGTETDAADPFTLAAEFTLAESCTLDSIWFYSPPGASVLPAECGIYDQATQALVSGTHVTSPDWSGAAGSGWIAQAYSGVTLAAGSYRVAVCSGATSTAWNDAVIAYFSTGPGASGITSGPLSAPGEAAAGSPGQGSYNAGASLAWPGTYDTGNAPDYLVDVEVTPAGGTPHTATAALTVTPSFSASPQPGRYRTASLTVTPSFTETRLHIHGRTAALTVTPSFTAARAVSHTRHAALTVTPGFTVTWTGGAKPAAPKTGSWWGLHSVFEESRQRFDEFRSRPPMACPVCGQPLVNAPATKSGSGVELYCDYAGDHQFYYPRDYHVPTRPWS